MINVLYTVNGMRVNGMSAVIMQYIRNLDTEEYSFAIFTDEIDPQFFPDLEKYKVQIIQSKMRRKNQFAYFKELLQLFRNQHFDILHAHGNSATIAVELIAAKQCGVPMRIAHSHNTTCDHKIIDKLLRPAFYASYTHGIGCGVEAGKWLFKDRCHVVIKNGVDLDRFKFDMEQRIRIRREIGIESDVVIGHIGRFTDQKNHIFLLDVFRTYLKRNPDAILLLVGNGPLKEKTKETAREMGISDKVIFYGTTPNTAAIYSAIDYFVFPSKYEGVPLTLVEAQANGLGCLISDKVSREVIITSLIDTLPLESVDDWAYKIPQQIVRKTETSNEAIEKLRQYGFDVEGVIEDIDSLYKQVTKYQRDQKRLK